MHRPYDAAPFKPHIMPTAAAPTAAVPVSGANG